MSDSLLHSFDFPAPTFTPTPIWWWSGEALRADRLRWQMEQLIAGGVRNAVVLNLASRGPTYGALSDDPPFLSEPWWELFIGVCRDAEELGFTLYFYDQFGFSGANLQASLVQRHPSYQGWKLDRTCAEGTGPLAVSAPTDATVLGAFTLDLEAGGSAVCVPFDEVGAQVDVGSRRSRLFVVHLQRDGFDYLSPEACADLLDTVHGEFERRVGNWFGSVIGGSFQDELQSMPSWSARFAAAFEEYCGYSIVPLLAGLWEDLGDLSSAVRADYQRTRALLAEQAFFEPLGRWHDERGLLAGFDQQHPARAGHPIAGTDYYGDYLRTHRWFSAPGSDHWGEGKVHSSMAHSYGRPRVWVEAFHTTGWGGTLEETYDWLIPWLRAGATLYNPHAVYYSTRGGWFDWAPPSTCWRQPYWRHYPLFAEATARLTSTLTAGHHVCDVAVLFPTTTAQADNSLGLPPLLMGHPTGVFECQDIYRALVGDMFWGQMTTGVLDGDCRDFDILDDDSLTRGQAQDGRVQVGNESFSTIVLPGCRVLETATVRALATFARQGVLVVLVGSAPELCVGGEGVEALEDLRRLVADGTVCSVRTAEEVPAALAGLARSVVSERPTLLRRVGEDLVLFVPAAFPGATAQTIANPFLDRIDFDPERYAEATVVGVRGASGPAALWDPGTGSRRALETRVRGDVLDVLVPFDDGPAAIVVLGPSAANEHAGPSDRDVTMAAGAADGPCISTLSGTWTGTVLPTGDNRWGDLALPPHPGPLPLGVWHLEHRLDHEDEWRPQLATYGQRGWFVTASPASQLPAPLPSHGDFAAPGWAPLSWSPSRGLPPTMPGDKKGYLPEEFLDFGPLAAGDGAQLRVAVIAHQAQRGVLELGGRALKRATWNGVPLDVKGSGYLASAAIEVECGTNTLELRYEAVVSGHLRGWFAVLDQPSTPARPEWVECLADDSSQPATLLCDVTVGSTPIKATVQFGTKGSGRLVINGTVVAQHGGFHNYSFMHYPTIAPYDVTAAFVEGLNRIQIEVDHPGDLFVLDGEVTDADGYTQAVLLDASWLGTQPGGRASAASSTHLEHDSRWIQLRPRPHPLPEAGWLEGLSPACHVGDVTALPGARAAEWFRYPLPPGAVEVTVPVDAASLEVWYHDVPVACVAGRVGLDPPAAGGDFLLLKVMPAGLGTGGGLWRGPSEVVVTSGQVSLDDWSTLGLTSFSGGLEYVTTLEVDDPTGLVLDLGEVRGTAEVTINGLSAGSRIWSPYRLAVGHLLRPGTNDVSIVIRNTLAPHLSGAAPTVYAFAGQAASGLRGPVRLLAPDSISSN